MKDISPTWILDGVPLWVDAICINQEDIPERNSQVQVMTRIYGTLDVVLGWLGLEADDSDHPIQKIREIDATFSQMSLDVDRLDWVFPHRHDLFKSGTNPRSNRFWDGIQHLLRRPYWGRAWIAQEIIMGRTGMLVLCGTSTFSLMSVMKFVGFMNWAKRRPCPSFADPDLWHYISSPLVHEKLATWRLGDIVVLQDLLAGQTRVESSESLGKRIVLSVYHRLASDPRDKIFSITSLFNHPMKPDYSLSTEDVYSSFARQCMMEENRLGLLRYSGHGMFPENIAEYPRHFLFLPSWVPDWDAHSKQHGRGQFHDPKAEFHADRHPLSLGPSLFSFKDNLLIARGLQWDKTSMVKRFEGRADADLCSFWVEYIANHADKPCVTGIPIVQAIARLLLLNREADTRKEIGQGASAQTIAKAIGAAMLILNDAKHGQSIDKFRCGSRELLSYQLQHELDEVEFKNLLHQIANVYMDSSLMPFIANVRVSLKLDHAIFTTERGYLGWGPPGMREGDFVCVLLGCETPLALRRIGSHYINIGLCYVLGIMDGEALEGIHEGSDLLQEFVIA